MSRSAKAAGSADAPSAAVDAGCQVLTVGHSTRPIDEFIALLAGHGVTRLVDVRTVLRKQEDMLPGLLKLAWKNALGKGEP